MGNKLICNITNFDELKEYTKKENLYNKKLEELISPIFNSN